MSITIALPPDMEASLRADADQEHRPVEEVASRRLQEAELMRRIFSYFPSAETREMRSLARKQQAGTLSEQEQRRFTDLAYQREIRNAARLADILSLSRLGGESVHGLMDHLGIHPNRMV